MFLEALGHAGGGGHGLLDAPRQAAVLAAGEGLAGEVVDAGGEAAVDEGGEHLVLGGGTGLA